jgi:hypothetical protein
MNANHAIVQGQRRCNRCLRMFPADATLFFPTELSWWLCERCSERLIGPDRLKGWRRTPQDGSGAATK